MKIIAVQMDNLTGFWGIRRIDRVLYAQIRKLYGVMKGVVDCSPVVQPYGGNGEISLLKEHLWEVA